MAAFYPAETPGGWTLIGRTAAPLWDPSRARPNLIAAGDAVTVRPAKGVDFTPPPQHEERETIRPELAFVIDGGQWTLVTCGTPDWSRTEYGLSPGGAFDPAAAAEANARVGNRRDAALLEVTFVGPTLRFLRRCRAAWVGPYVPLKQNGREQHADVLDVKEGDTLQVSALQRGVRGWLALEGGVATSGRMESEPQRVRRHSLLYTDDLRDQPSASRWSLPRSGELRVGVGPHPVSEAMREFVSSETWKVSVESDRRGVRLHPRRPPSFSLDARLRTIGLEPGAVQWHPDGALVVMGPDHPFTGGYLQPFTVLIEEVAKVSQLRPGEELRLTIV
jgi:allophanate hydrolase subunit 2